MHYLMLRSWGFPYTMLSEAREPRQWSLKFLLYKRSPFMTSLQAHCMCCTIVSLFPLYTGGIVWAAVFFLHTNVSSETMSVMSNYVEPLVCAFLVNEIMSEARAASRAVSCNHISVPGSPMVSYSIGQILQQIHFALFCLVFCYSKGPW